MKSMSQSEPFKPQEIIYENENFRIAVGSWFKDKKRKYIAMRWEPDEKNEYGYPRNQWFVIPNELAKKIVPAISGLEGSNENAIKTLIFDPGINFSNG